ncbi:MAG: MGMT family protein [Candidatus Thorarchaeota archaeon]|jgi:O-6-methylguanine DNA methyltransferase
MKYGVASIDNGNLFVLMEDTITHIMLSPHTPDIKDLEKDNKASEIAQKAKKWIEYGKEFFYPISMTGTPFQQEVYTITQTIPKGKVTTYKAVAEKMGSRAYRAVGQALHANKILLLIPCHRVIGSDRTLTGFGSGIAMKQKILENEGVAFEGEKVKKEYILDSL